MLAVTFLVQFSHVFVFVFVFACVFVFVIVITGRQWIVRVMSFRNMYGYIGCEASEVNNLTVWAVGPNGHNNKDVDNKIQCDQK